MGGVHGDPGGDSRNDRGPACASGLKKRLTPSRFMQIATPIASVLLTMALGAIIFQLIGFDGPRAIFYEPYVVFVQVAGRHD